MKKEIWESVRGSPDQLGRYRGIRVRVIVDKTSGKATFIKWFLNGELDESSPINAELEDAKEIALQVVNHLIAQRPEYAAAEHKAQAADRITIPATARKWTHKK